MATETLRAPPQHPRVASLAVKQQPISKKKARRREKEAALLSNLSSLPTVSKQPDASRPVFPRSVKSRGMPYRLEPTLDPHSAQCGHFTMTSKGIKKRLKRIGPDSGIARLVSIIETEIADWIHTDVSFDFDRSHVRLIDPEIVPICEGGQEEPSIVERHRDHSSLQWIVARSFTRFLVHLICRLWDVVSYSRTDSTTNRRITYLLRPSTTQPDPLAMRHGANALATPPTTDLDPGATSSSAFYTDLSSDTDLTDSESDWSDIERPLAPDATVSQSSRLRPISSDSEDNGADISDLDSIGEHMTDSVDSLTFADATPTRWNRIE